MVVRIGTDLVKIERFKRKIANSPSILKRLFTSSELDNQDPIHLAGIFAAKEAAIKALGLQKGKWLDMEVHHRENGEPIMKLPKEIESKLLSCDLSISHDGDYVVATFIVLKT